MCVKDEILLLYHWHPLIPKNYPYEGDLTRPMPTPFFLKEEEGNRSIAIMNAGGEGNCELPTT